MEYKYKILDEAYYWMLSKQKNIEVRLLNEKSKKIQVGDFVTFYNIKREGKFIKVKIIDKNTFDNVDDLIKKYDINHIMPNHTIKDIKEALTKIYGDETLPIKPSKSKSQAEEIVELRKRLEYLEAENAYLKN